MLKMTDAVSSDKWQTHQNGDRTQLRIWTNSTANPSRVRPQTLLWIGFAVLSMALSHEFAHWSSCEMLGYTSYLRLNAAGPLIDYSLAWHAAAVDVAGPLLTVLSACTFYYFIVVRGVRQLLPFLLVWLAMRLLASIFGVLTMLNDEAW